MSYPQSTMSSSISQSISSPLDILGLPDDITRRIQVFHANPICDDKYFQFCKKERLWHQMSEYSCKCPFELLNYYACHLAGNFHYSMIYSGYTGFRDDSLATILEDNGGEHNWGNSQHEFSMVCYDADYSAKFLPNSGETFWHKFITKYMWLNEYVREYRDYQRSWFLKMAAWPKEKVYTGPNKTMMKKELITLLDNNGIYFCKSWSKSKLINAWYKSTM